MKADILGVKVDKINQTEALVQIEKWIWNPGKHYIVTPNLEFILSAQSDPEFKKILNSADMAIPDSSSLGFTFWLQKRNTLIKLLLWPLMLLPLKQLIQFERVAGTDLMEALCKLAAEKGFVVGFLGGGKSVAEKAADCLQKKYPGLKVNFARSGGKVDDDGNVIARSPDLIGTTRQSTTEDPSSAKGGLRMTGGVDILFVGFGHVKQEKWIANNLDKIPVKLAMGVGGAFDYFSGSVLRAPGWMRALGFEWLFRLIVQPWRIKRQISLCKLIWFMLQWNNSARA